MPLKPDDHPAAGVRTGQPDGRADYLTARIGEPDLFHTGTASVTLRAASISSSYGRPKQVPSSLTARVTASVTTGCRSPGNRPGPSR